MFLFFRAWVGKKGDKVTNAPYSRFKGPSLCHSKVTRGDKGDTESDKGDKHTAEVSLAGASVRATGPILVEVCRRGWLTWRVLRVYIKYEKQKIPALREHHPSLRSLHPGLPG